MAFANNVVYSWTGTLIDGGAAMSGWTSVDVAGVYTITQLSCLPTGYCMAADDAGNAYVYADQPAITTTSLTTATYGTPYSATLSATGGTSPYSWSETGLPSWATLSSSGVISGTPTATGATAITITVTDANNETASAVLVLTVDAATQTIGWHSTPTSPVTVGEAYDPFPFAVDSSGIPIVISIDSASTPGTCNLNGYNVVFDAAGSCVIDANQAGNSDYAPAPEEQQVVTVEPQPQAITWTSTQPSDPTVGGSYTPTATGRGVSGEPVVISIDGNSTSGACSMSSGVVSFTGLGSCVIDANQAGNTHYAPAPQVQQVLTVDSAPLTAQAITWTSTQPSSPVVGGTYSPTATGGGSDERVVISIDPGSTSGACSISSGVVSFTGTGSCLVDANQAGNSSYSPAPQVQQVLTVDSAPLTAQAITWTSTQPSSPVVGGTYSPTAAGGGSGNPVVISIDPASTSGACSISSGVVSFTGPGTCLIDANQAGDSDYDPAPQAQQALSVNPAPLTSQTITWISTPPSSPVVGGSYAPAAAGGGASGEPVVLSIDIASTSGACSISGGVVSFTGPGTCLVDANQAGNSDYSAAPQVQQVLTINPAPLKSQTITIAPPPIGAGPAHTSPQEVGSSYVPVVHGGASSNPVVLSVSGVCSVSSGRVSFTAVGNCTITGTQAGNSSYLPGVGSLTLQISAGVPSVVTSLTAKPGNGKIVLSWSPPVNDNDGTITGYAMFQQLPFGGWSAFPTYTVTGLTYTVTGLTNGTTYSFAVAGVDSAGDGPTAGVSATPKAAVATTTTTTGTGSGTGTGTGTPTTQPTTPTTQPVTPTTQPVTPTTVPTPTPGPVPPVRPAKPIPVPGHLVVAHRLVILRSGAAVRVEARCVGDTACLGFVQLSVARRHHGHGWVHPVVAEGDVRLTAGHSKADVLRATSFGRPLLHRADHDHSWRASGVTILAAKVTHGPVKSHHAPVARIPTRLLSVWVRRLYHPLGI